MTRAALKQSQAEGLSHHPLTLNPPQPPRC